MSDSKAAPGVEGVSQPLVSVIIPTFDVRDYIRETLDALVAQSYRPLEVIVADDGSADDTCDVVTTYDSRDVPLELLRLRHTGNPALARNTALGVSRGSLIAYLDADDICDPTRIAQSVDALRLAGPGAELVFCDYSTIDGKGRPIDAMTLSQYSALQTLRRQRLAEGVYRLRGCDVHDALLGASFIRPSQVLVTAGLMRRSRGFDERLRNAHDLDLFLELVRSTDVVWLDRELVKYRHRDGNMTSRGLLRMAASRIEVLERHRRHAYTAAGRHNADKRLADVYGSLAFAHRSAGRGAEALRAHVAEFRARPGMRPLVGATKAVLRQSRAPFNFDWWSRHLFHPLWDIKDGSSRLDCLRRLERSQWRPEQDLYAEQLRLLREQATHAVCAVPHYADLFRQAGLEPSTLTLESLRNLPVLTKATIRELGPRLVAAGFDIGKLPYHKTGGSTGVALQTWFDPAWEERRNADALRANQWAGWYHGMKVAAIWGNPPVARTLKQKLRSALYDRILYLDTMRIDDAALADFVRRWRRERPGVVFGHSHSLFLVAKYLREQGIVDLRPQGIVSTSMMLLPQERAVIEQAFGCKVTDRYGCEEVALIACECELHRGMHLNIEHLVVEFLDDRGRPVPAGEEGRIVVTDLYNRAMPLIRYEVGDVGVPAERRCECGRGLPLMEQVIGRVADYLKRRDGSLVAGVSLVERTLTKVPGIEQMQVVQPSLGRLVVNYVPGAGFAETTQAALAAEFEAGFGEPLELEFRSLDRIPQERSGKYRFSICQA
jgi:phenylacetate-CoA ligase